MFLGEGTLPATVALGLFLPQKTALLLECALGLRLAPENVTGITRWGRCLIRAGRRGDARKGLAQNSALGCALQILHGWQPPGNRHPQALRNSRQC